MTLFSFSMFNFFNSLLYNNFVPVELKGRIYLEILVLCCPFSTISVQLVTL